jgi:lipid-A-disaccharide synthase
MPAARRPKVMLVAAEASGDSLGAGLARALRARLGGEIDLVGVGGPAMGREGVASPFDISELSVLGLLEGLRAYPRVLRRVADVARLAARERPDAAVLIDSWGFTLRVARRLRRLDPDLPLIKYVGPQVWASRPGRAKVLARSVDRLLSIHAFDAPFFEKEGLPTTFVGTAALARDHADADPQRLRSALGAAPGQAMLLLLPGSRPAEIRRLGPVYADVAKALHAERPDLLMVLPVAETVAELVEAEVAGWAAPVRLLRGEEAKYDAMAAADLALACSGTVTTELALAGCPMVVTYRVGPMTHVILKRLLTTRYATLFNIAAGEAVAPEYLQDACAPGPLLEALRARLDDKELARRQALAQTAALARMGRGGGDPSERAAAVVAETLAGRRGEGSSG